METAEKGEQLLRLHLLMASSTPIRLCPHQEMLAPRLGNSGQLTNHGKLTDQL